MKIILYFFILMPAIIYSQCNNDLSTYASGFDNLKANSFEFLDDKLNDVKIVGYGEDTHGSAEFTLLAKELMEYLTNKHDFRILIIETGFGEALYFNDYIQGRRNDIKHILNEINSTWRYRTKEFIALMNWLKEYNKHSKSKIKIYGCEMQYVKHDVSRIQKYLSQVDSDYIIDGFEKHLWQAIKESEKSDYYISYAKLKNYFIDNKKEFINKTSKSDYNLIYHHIEVLGQFVMTINQNVEQRKHDLRDLYMAENIEWIINNKQNTKALFWAHNAHIGDWVSNGNVNVAGYHLRKWYGNAYYNIATDFGTGKFLAFPHNANDIGWNLSTFSFDTIHPKTFTNCLKKQGNPNTFLDLRNAKKNKKLKYYLEEPLTIMYGAGSQEWGTETETVDIGKAFDAIIYINEVTPIHWMQ